MNTIEQRILFNRSTFLGIAGGRDYSPILSTIEVFPTISSSSYQVCINLTIIEDEILEYTEYFLVILTTDNFKVNILRGRLQVSIEDNDSRLCSMMRVIIIFRKD